MANKMIEILKKRFVLDFFDSPDEVFDEINGLKHSRYFNFVDQDYVAYIHAAKDQADEGEFIGDRISANIVDYDEIEDCISVEDLEDIEDFDIEYLEALLQYEM